MNHIEEAIRALPKEEQLDEAFLAIGNLIGLAHTDMAFFVDAGLARAPARMAVMLNDNWAGWMPAGDIAGRIGCSPNCIPVYHSRIKALFPGWTEAKRNKGYRALHRQKISWNRPPAVYNRPVVEWPSRGPARPWTEQEERDLTRMYLTRSTLESMAYELDRTRWAAQQRLVSLGLTSRRSKPPHVLDEIEQFEAAR